MYHVFDSFRAKSAFAVGRIAFENGLTESPPDSWLSVLMQVLNGTDNATDVMATLCGSTIPAPIFLDTNSAELVFATDSSVQHTGFDITFLASPEGSDAHKVHAQLELECRDGTRVGTVVACSKPKLAKQEQTYCASDSKKVKLLAASPSGPTRVVRHVLLCPLSCKTRGSNFDVWFLLSPWCFLCFANVEILRVPSKCKVLGATWFRTRFTFQFRMRHPGSGCEVPISLHFRLWWKFDCSERQLHESRFPPTATRPTSHVCLAHPGDML